MRDRAWRRRQQALHKRRVRNWWWVIDGALTDDPVWLGKAYQTPHPCSGMCCGNPRKWFGALTCQERRCAGAMRDQLDER